MPPTRLSSLALRLLLPLGLLAAAGVSPLWAGANVWTPPLGPEGGVAWTEVALAPGGPLAAAVDPAAPATVYAGTPSNGVYTLTVVPNP